MALSKIIETDTGVPVSYHRIIECNIDYLKSKTQVILGHYYTQEARMSGASQVYKTIFTFDIVDDATRADLYNLIHESIFWADAEDC